MLKWPTKLHNATAPGLFTNCPFSILPFLKCFYHAPPPDLFRDDVFLFVTALLKYILYTTKLTHLKCTIQLFLVYLQGCTTIIIIYFQSIVIIPKRNLLPISGHSPPTSPSAQPQTITSLPSVSIDLLILDISYKQGHAICGQSSVTVYSFFIPIFC